MATRVQTPKIPGVVVAAAVVAGLCVLGYDGIRVGQLRLGTGDAAQVIALHAASSYHAVPNVDAAYAAAVAEAQVGGGTIAPTDFRVAVDGTVTLTLTRTTHTLVLRRLSRGVETSTGTGSAKWQP